MTIREAWRAQSLAGYNAYCEERGYTYAMLPEPGMWRKFKGFVRLYSDAWRERIARKICPWLEVE